jgi:hypothetical protein
VAAIASIIIEVQDGQATAAFQKLNAESAKLGTTLQPVQRISEQTFNNIEGGALKARESAALLGEEFGVKVPRALRGVIAESALLGPAFTAAFSGLAVVGFIEIVKLAVDHLTGFSAALTAIQKQNSELMQSATAASKAMLGPQTLEQVNSRILATEKSVGALNEQLGLTGNLFGDSLTRGLTKYSAAGALAVEELDKQKTLLNDLYGEQAKLLDEQKRTEPIEVLKLQNAARLEGLEGIKKINEAERGETAVIRAEMNANIVTAQVGTAEINEIHRKASWGREQMEREVAIEETKAYGQAYINAASTYNAKFELAKGEERIRKELNAKLFEIDEEELKKGMSLDGLRVAAKMEAENQIVALHHANAVKMRLMEDETLNIEKAAAVAMAPPWERANMAIIQSYQERMAKIKLELDAGRLDSEHAARQAAAAWQEEFAKMRDKLATDMETLFDNITSGNIGKFFLTQFKHLVFQMLATWILGMQGMKNASQQQMGSGGGILGAIFGGIFGGGGFGGGASGGPGGTPTFGGGLLGGGGNGDFGGEAGGSSGGGLASGLFGSLGLSAGGGAGAGTTLPSGAGPGGMGGGAAAGPIGQLLGKLFSHGAGPISGSMLATLGIGLLADSFMKGGWLRGFEGAAGGALTGFAIAGPIGALIGGIVGFFAGFISHSTKKARLQIEANIKAQAKAIEDGYNLFQIDWTGSRSQLEALRQQGVDALKQAGVKDISRSRVGHVDQWIDKAEKEIDATQAERNRRGAIAFGPAQFRVGGFVGAGVGGAIPSWFAGTAMHFAGGGAVPAILHEGEYVMRPEAVSSIGRGNLDRMNSGGGAGEHTHVHVHTMDSQSFSEWLRGGGLKEILRETRRAQNEGWA